MSEYRTYLLLCLMLFACGRTKESKDDTEGEETPQVQTPVTVTQVASVPLEESIELNATSTYLQRNFIKASANGYIKSVDVRMGQQVVKGQQVFTLQTKEARALGNTINKLDPSFHFTGLIHIKATASGFVQELNHQSGDYVQDGEQLAVLVDQKSFGFVLNLPYEWRAYVLPGQSLQVLLPDKTLLNANVSRILPDVDSVSQTETVWLSVQPSVPIPQNLIGKVHIIKNRRTGTNSLPREAVLADESQEHFWVMKMIDSVTAVKVPVVKGIEAGGRIEILQPHFSTSDLILLTGNYGLPDTARVRVVKTAE